MIDFDDSIFKLKQTDDSFVGPQVMQLMTKGEEIIGVYKAIRDYVVFTNKRLITINVKGITGSKKDITSLPYKRINAFSVETAGTLDLDSELELYFSGLGKVRIEFSGNSDIVRIGNIISEYAL
ncbi:MAG: PH domain-containing protein [Bacteroidales bacterium]|nr:PH domain-containing protein [Bacteroidales bacterium]